MEENVTRGAGRAPDLVYSQDRSLDCRCLVTWLFLEEENEAASLGCMAFLSQTLPSLLGELQEWFVHCAYFPQQQVLNISASKQEKF